MAVYSGMIGSNIGSLLRQIQETRQSNPIMDAPAAAVASPIRQAMNTPVMGAQSPGSQQVVNIKPESATAMPSQSVSPTPGAGMATPQPSRIGPIGIGGGDMNPATNPMSPFAGLSLQPTMAPTSGMAAAPASAATPSLQTSLQPAITPANNQDQQQQAIAGTYGSKDITGVFPDLQAWSNSLRDAIIQLQLSKTPQTSINPVTGMKTIGTITAPPEIPVPTWAPKMTDTNAVKDVTSGDTTPNVVPPPKLDQQNQDTTSVASLTAAMNGTQPTANVPGANPGGQVLGTTAPVTPSAPGYDMGTPEMPQDKVAEQAGFLFRDIQNYQAMLQNYISGPNQGNTNARAFLEDHRNYIQEGARALMALVAQGQAGSPNLGIIPSLTAMPELPPPPASVVQKASASPSANPLVHQAQSASNSGSQNNNNTRDANGRLKWVNPNAHAPEPKKTTKATKATKTTSTLGFNSGFSKGYSGGRGGGGGGGGSW